MEILITGGAGFIGSNIARKLVELGIKPRILDNLSTGKAENMADIRDEVEFIQGDIRDVGLLERLIQQGDTIVHQAAIPSVPRSVDDPMGTSEVNIMGTLTLLNEARRKKARRFVYASSSSVYGNNPAQVKTETLPVSPLSPYAAAKLAGETMCQAFHEVYGLPTVSLRYFNVFGPYQDETSFYSAVIPKFITRMLEGQPPLIFGDGLQSRDFTFIDNVVDANLRAAGVIEGASEEAFGRTMNTATNNRYSLLRLVEIINNNLGTDFQPEFADSRPGDVKHSLADIALAQTLLGYHPKLTFEEGIRMTIEWYKRKIRE